MPLYPGHGPKGQCHSLLGHIFDPLSTACNTKRIWSGMPKIVIILPMIHLEEQAQMMWHAIWACPSQLERQVSWVKGFSGCHYK